jgi:Zn finger protein HypA/HybF involved in hydrogenase expression
MTQKQKSWLAALLLGAAAGSLIAGDQLGFKCRRESCSFAPEVMFGGTMLSERVMGWCQQCKAFQGISWTRENSPLLEPGEAVVPPPQPVAEVWVASLGQVRRVYRCPDCDGSFLEIRGPEELTHCPKCGDARFAVDPDAPHIAVD